MLQVVTFNGNAIAGNFANVIIKIKGTCYLNNNLYLGPGCILDFDGGNIISYDHSIIVGNLTEIRAAKYQIFTNVVLAGSFTNSSFYVEWFGPIGENQDTNTIQLAVNICSALQSCASIEMGSMEYKINQPIVLKNPNQTLICHGTIVLSTDIPAIVLQSTFQNVYVREIKGANNGNWNNRLGTGFLVNQGLSYSKISVDKLMGLKVGFDFTLSEFSDNKIKYNKINWQYIDSKVGININITNCESNIDGCVFGENQFNGGRLYCKYGIVIEGKEGDNNMINGNVFNCIGFEGYDDLMMETPIKVKSARLNNFHDLRMSEGIVQTTLTNQNGDIIGFESTYIDLEDCEFMDFSIKSILPFNFVKSIRCNNISIRASVSDKGMGSRYKGRDTIFINQTNPNNGADLSGPIHYSVSSNIVPQNYYQKFEFRKSLIINFDMLFVRDVQGQVVMSNIVELEFKTPEYVDDNKTITIDFSNSSYRLHPEMIICFRGIVGSKLKFINSAEANQSITNNTLTRHGTYKVAFDRDENIFIVPLAYFD